MAQEFGHAVGDVNSTEEVISKASELFENGKFLKMVLLLQFPGNIFGVPYASFSATISGLEHIREIVPPLLGEYPFKNYFGETRFRLCLLDVDWLNSIIFPFEGHTSTLVVISRIGESEFLPPQNLRRVIATMTFKGPGPPKR